MRIIKSFLLIAPTIILGAVAIWFINKGISAYQALPYQRIINDHQRLTFMETKGTSLLWAEYLGNVRFQGNTFRQTVIEKVNSIAHDEQILMQQIGNILETQRNTSRQTVMAKVDSIAHDEQILMQQIENFPETYAEMVQDARILHELMVTFRTYRANNFKELSNKDNIMKIYTDTLIPIAKRHPTYSIYLTEEESRFNNTSVLEHLLFN